MWQRWNGTSHVFEKSDDNGSSWAPLPLSAATITEGILSNSRLSGVALTNVSNTFVAAPQIVAQGGNSIQIAPTGVDTGAYVQSHDGAVYRPLAFLGGRFSWHANGVQSMVLSSSGTLSHLVSPAISIDVGGYTSQFIQDGTGLKFVHNSAVRHIQCIANTGGVTLAPGSTAWASISDERQKNILGSVTDALNKLLNLSSIYYTLKDDSENISHIGLIAQEVQAVLPEAVSSDSEGILSLRYTDLIPLLVSAIQEMAARLVIIEAK